MGKRKSYENMFIIYLFNVCIFTETFLHEGCVREGFPPMQKWALRKLYFLDFCGRFCLVVG